jgi:hypothetical protein
MASAQAKTTRQVIPRLTSSAPKPWHKLAAALLVSYKIPSSGSYDWSSFQPQSFTKDFVVWAEDFPVGDTQSRVAAGINYDAQGKDDFRSFLAGAVFALAGAAILAAFQEVLHSGEKDA